ncbi:MAG: glycosyltransferase [bacterium]
MYKIKILSDIKIPQSPIWGEQTDLLLENIDKMQKYKSLIMFRSLINIIKNYQKYDAIVIANIKTAQYFGLYKKIFHLKKTKFIVLELMLDQDKYNIHRKIKNLFQRLCFSTVDIIFVSSKDEIKIYSNQLGIHENRFHFLPFHTNIIEPKKISLSEEYILSAGKTGRDYETLALAAEGLDIPVIVISDELSVRGIQFPKNVQVKCDISYQTYLRYLYRSKVVVVPLKKSMKSTGQVVFLEAMGIGKPVVVTDTTGSKDYIEHGVNGILVPHKDPDKLKRHIMNLWNDHDLRNEISTYALKQIKKNHTFDIYTSKILRTIKELCNNSFST